MHHLSDSIAYTLKASLVVITNLSADLEASHSIKLFAQQIPRPVRPVSEHASNLVRTMGVTSRGECEISAQMDHDVWVAGDILLVQTSIHNWSTMNMSSISLKLYEIINFTRPGRTEVQGSMCICESKVSGVRAGDHQDQVLSLPLVGKLGLLPESPTTSSTTFVQWTYKLVIKCKFNMATGVEVELPVAVLPRANPRDVNTAAASVVVAALELDNELPAVKPIP